MFKVVWKLRAVASVVCRRDVVVLSSAHDINDGRLYRHAHDLGRAGTPVYLVGFGEPWPAAFPSISVISLGQTSPWKRLIVATFGPLLLRNCVLVVVDPELILASRIRSELFRSKWILDVHENYWTVERKWNRRWLGRLIGRVLVGLAFRAGSSADIVVAAADFPVPGQDHPEFVVPNLPLTDFREILFNTGQRSAHQSSTGRLILGYVGDLTMQRGLDFALEAIRESNVVDFVAIGEVRDSRLFGARPKGSHFMGRLSYLESWRAALNFDLGLIPLPPTNQYASAMPTKLYEYASIGVPVIIRAGTIAAVEVEAKGLGWIYYDQVDLQRLLAGLVEDRTSLVESGHRCREWCEDLINRSRVDFSSVVNPAMAKWGLLC